jgi:hypothetical protein
VRVSFLLIKQKEMEKSSLLEALDGIPTLVGLVQETFPETPSGLMQDLADKLQYLSEEILA